MPRPRVHIEREKKEKMSARAMSNLRVDKARVDRELETEITKRMEMNIAIEGNEAYWIFRVIKQNPRN